MTRKSGFRRCAEQIFLAVIVGALMLIGCQSGEHVDTGSGPYNLKVVITQPAHNSVMPVGSYQFAAQVTTAKEGDSTFTLTWTWESPEGRRLISGELEPEISFLQPGTFIITVTVKDEEGYTDTSSVTITVVRPEGSNLAILPTATAEELAAEAEEAAAE